MWRKSYNNKINCLLMEDTNCCKRCCTLKCHLLIIFVFIGSNRPDFFEINESTGDISVKNLFDREELLDIDTTVMLTLMVSANHQVRQKQS